MNKENLSQESGQCISDLISDLSPNDVDFISFPSSESLSSEKIKQLALEKREAALFEEKSEQKETKLPKKPVKLFTKIMAMVAAALMLSMTAFAFSQSDMMRSLFKGENKEIIDSALFYPMESAEANGVTMTLQSMLSDGYNAFIVVSLENADYIAPEETVDLKIGDTEPLFIVRFKGKNSGLTRKLEDYSTEKIQYFVIRIYGEIPDPAMTIQLNKSIAPISLQTTLVSNLTFTSIPFPENTAIEGVVLKELNISPLGFIMKVKYDEYGDGLPKTKVTLVFKGGEKKDFFIGAPSQDENLDRTFYMDVLGENGILSAYGYGASPMGYLSQMSGGFSEVQNIDDLEEIIIDGVSYPVQ